MSFVAAAIIGGGAALGGAYLSSKAAGDAADKQAASSQYANDLQYQMYNQQRQDQTPWREAGMRALSGMENADYSRDFGPNDMQLDPGYQFRLSEGQKALERSAAAKGSLQSGGFMKGLTDYSQGAASQEYGNAYNRFNSDRDRRFGRLSTLAGYGNSANAALNQAGQYAATNIGNISTSNANAQGAAGIAQSNAWGGAMNGIGNNAMNYSLYSNLMQKQPGTTTPVSSPYSSGGYNSNGTGMLGGNYTY